MTLYNYSPSVAIDVLGNLVTSGTGLIYAVEDTAGVNPLTLLDPNGNPMVGGVDVTPLHLIPGFAVEDAPVALWRSGSVSIPLSADGARIPGGGTTGQMLVKNSPSNYDVQWADAPTGGGGGTGGGTGAGNGDYYNKQQTVPVITIASNAPWPTDAPVGALIVRLTGQV